MSKVYHVLNDYSLEELTTKEAEQFNDQAPGLREHPGKVKGAPATCYRNVHGELVYIRVESWEDLNGYKLQGPKL